MNKTFKIVFNKARGALMVANEITGSVQKKGIAQITTAVALGLVSLTPFAADVAPHPFLNWDTTGVNSSSGFAFALTDVPENYPVGILINGNASGSISNADISLIARNETHPYPAAVRTLYQRGANSNITFDGDFTNVSLNTNYTGSGNSEASTFTNYAGTANFNAKNTTFTSKTDYKNGKFVIALEAYGVDGKSEINLNGDSVTLTAESNVDRISTTAVDANRRGAVEGIGAFKNATINSSAKVFTVNVSSLGETVAPTQELGTDNKYLSTAPDGKVGAADAVGFAAGGGQIKIANQSHIKVNAIGGTATGLDAYDSYYTSTTGVVDLDGAGIILDDANINVTSEKSVATGIKGSQTVSKGVLVNIRGNLQLDVTSSQSAAYGINLDGGRSVIGAAGKDVVINVSSPSVLSRNVWVHNGGNLSFGQEGNKVNSVTLNNKGTGDSDPFFIARIDKGSTLNVYANSYSQTGSGHGLYVVGDNATLNMDVDSFVSSSAYTAIHTREAETAAANIKAKVFQATATATSDETGVALLQFNEGSTINVTADDVSLTGTKKLGGGVLGTGTWGTVNLTANNTMVLNGNINGVYGGVNNNGKTAAFNIKAKTLSLNGDINVGSLNESKGSTKTDGAISNFSRNTNVSVTAEQAAITGNINVWGNASGNDKDVGKLNNSDDINIVNLNLGDGSVISGDISIIGQGQATNQVAITATGTNKNLTFTGDISASNQGSLILNGGTYSVGSLTLDSASLSLNSGTLAIGASIASVQSALSKMTGLNAPSILYVGEPLTLNGSTISVGTGTATQIATYDGDSASTAASVKVASDGALVVDQAAVGNSAVFTDATVTFDGGQLGIANATPNSTLTLSKSVEGNPDSVVTDNPFIEGTYSDGVLTTALSSEGGLGALASTGIQAMTRRADTVLAQTIADRTSVDQELAAGTNLWVDVTGERYEADKLDNGGEFKSDMGYGAFGADFAVTQDITAGAAFQYGKGTLRSGVSSIKNSIDSYGVTAYGAMKFGDAKVVAEASYIKNENDITSSQTALNQSVDSEIYSVGVRGQHRFTAGNFQFVPSVGVRVSRLNTDAMQVGAVNVKKQEQTLVQVPIALRVNGFEQNVNGWSVAPSFKVAYVPTFGDKEISVLGADQTVIDTSPVQGDFGIRAQNGNLMVNANMMLGGGKDGTSSVGGKVGLKYVF